MKLTIRLKDSFIKIFTNKKSKTLFLILFSIMTITGCIAFITFMIHLIYPVDTAEVLIVSNIRAGDLLTFIGSFLSFIGTVLLGTITIIQNKKIAGMEQDKLKPVLDFEGCQFIKNGNHDDNKINLLFHLEEVDRPQIYDVPTVKLKFKNTTAQHISFQFYKMEFRKNNNEPAAYTIKGHSGKFIQIPLKPFESEEIQLLLIKNEISQLEELSFITIEFILTNSLTQRYRETIEIVLIRLIDENITIYNNGIKKLEKL